MWAGIDGQAASNSVLNFRRCNSETERCQSREMISIHGPRHEQGYVQMLLVTFSPTLRYGTSMLRQGVVPLWLGESINSPLLTKKKTKNKNSGKLMTQKNSGYIT